MGQAVQPLKSRVFGLVKSRGVDCFHAVGLTTLKKEIISAKCKGLIPIYNK